MQVFPARDTLQGLVDALTTHPLLLAVGITCATYFFYTAARSYQEYRADIEFGRRHGCLPPPQLPNHWPLGVDRLKELWESIYSSYVNSRRKNIWGSDADLFIPERWDRPELGAMGWAYFPFSGGPRLCLGQDFALMEVSYTIVRVLQAFQNISLPRNEEIEPLGTERQRLTLVLSSADGCRVQLGEVADTSKMTM